MRLSKEWQFSACGDGRVTGNDLFRQRGAAARESADENRLRTFLHDALPARNQDEIVLKRRFRRRSVVRRARRLQGVRLGGDREGLAKLT